MRMRAYATSATLLFFMMTLFETKSEEFNFEPLNCGHEKNLYEAKGVIQTPNFPRAFEVPIRCRWVIDASNFTSVGGKVEIYVYLTQLFVRTGLKMTEYKLYDKDSKIGYSDVTLLKQPAPSNEEFQVVRTNLTFLVIDFELDMLEGNHLRVLHGLMDVFGFNITYEITTNGERSELCTVNQCSLVGHCYAKADFSSYKCSCFKGFYGENCGFGPLCGPGKNSCANGATCRYVGETMVVCDCFNGTCEVPVTNRSSGVDFFDAVQCPYDQRSELSQVPCGCQNPEYANEGVDRLRYVVTVRLANTSVISNDNSSSTMAVQQKLTSEQSPEERIWKEMEKFVKKSKFTRYESLQIINATRAPLFNQFSFHFFTNKSEEQKVRGMLETMKSKKVIPNMSYQVESIIFRLLGVHSNAEQNIVHEGEEFILSCLAQGSSGMTFNWYKDGLLVNASMATRSMWYETRVYEDDKYSSLLGIQRAELYDIGTYTCQVKDWQQQQCKSIKVDVMQTARFSMKPLYKTTNKGDNVTILCLSKNGWDNDRFGYTWVREDGLVKMDAPRIYYEDLYRGGSVLHVNGIQKSETFTCNTVSIRVDVLDPTRIPFCERDGVWDATIGGAQALYECPENYSDSIARRLCAMIDTHTAAWQLPDFSQCISNTLNIITEDFHKVTLGYTNDAVTAANTLMALWSALRTSKFLPGEGEFIVQFLSNVYDFLQKNRMWVDFCSATKHFFGIVDLLLQDSTSIVNREAVFKFSNLLERWTSSWISLNDQRNQTLVNSSQFKSFELHVPYSHRKVVRLHQNVSIRVERLEFNNSDNTTATSRLSIIMYEKLSDYLLPKYVSNQHENRQLIYERTTPVVQILLADELPKHRRRTNSSSWLQVDVEFQLPLLKRLAAVKWHICCGLVFSFGQSWNLDTCERISVSTRSLKCSCNRAGFFAMFVAELPQVEYEEILNYQLVPIIGCALCFLQCIVSLCVLLFRWLKMRSTLGYLKLQVCVSTATSMILFLYGSCNPSVEVYPYLLSGLQLFLVTSITSHISILIVMYIDIVSLKKIPEIDRSAIAVMAFCPMILVMVSPLSRKINGEKVTCWWLCKGSLMFYVNLIVGFIFCVLFLFLYTCLMRKLFFLWNATKVERSLVMQRISFLHYTTFIFLITVFVAVSSMFYVNIRNTVSQCVFGSSCALLGFVIFICYVPRNEVLFCLKVIFPSLKRTRQRHSPDTSFISGMQRTAETYDGDSLHSTHSDRYSENLLMNVYRPSSTSHMSPKTRKKKSVAFPDDLITDEGDASAEQHTLFDESNSSLESNNHLPEPQESNDVWLVTKQNHVSTNYLDETRPYSPILRQSHPEMLTTRVCVELGVMKNPSTSDSGVPGKNGSTVVICSVDVEPCPGHVVELNEVKFTTNAIGSLDCTQKQPELPDAEITSNGVIAAPDKTDVLDRISQDLDYLLNRSPSPSNSKMVSSPKVQLMGNHTKFVKPKS